jgi:hypothetical protein
MTRRELLKAASGSAMGLTIGATHPSLARTTENSIYSSNSVPAASTTDVLWYKRTLVGMEVGPSQTNAEDPTFYSKVSGKAIVDNLLKAKVEYAVIFMKDPDFAYYDSKVVRKCPSLGKRDLLREVLDAASEHKLPIIAYVVIQYDTSAWLAHPEWRMEDWEGNSVRPRLCFNSDYLEYTKRIAAELMRYEIVGFHFDMLDFGFAPPFGCFCQRYCQPLFHEVYGIEMPHPAMPTWDEDWDKLLAFRANSNAHFSKELAKLVHATRSDVAVDFNYHGYPPFSWVEGELPVKHAINGDFVTAEGLPWAFGYNNVSLLPLFLSGARLGGPVQVASSRSMYDYYDPTIRPVNDMKWEVSTYHAHGAQVTIVDKINYDGSQDPVVYERLGEVFGAAREMRDYFRHQPLQEVGIYYSARSRDWFGKEDTIRYDRAFYGAHKALMQSQITIGIVMDENLSPERLSEFVTLYLPNTAILSQKEIDLIDQYVGSGGNLLITGLAGIYDHYGRLQNNSALTQIIGAEFTRAIEDEHDNFVRLPASLLHGEEASLGRQIPSDWPMSVWGPVTVYKPLAAQPFGEVLVRFESGSSAPWTRHLSAGEAVGPAIFVNKYGKGKVIYVACSPDAAVASDYRMPEHRYLLRNILRYLNPNPLVSINAPASVEVVVSQDKGMNRQFVHLVAFNSPASSVAAPVGESRRALPPPMEEPLYYEATIQIARPFSTVSTASGKTEISRRGNQIRLRTTQIYEVLILGL